MTEGRQKGVQDKKGRRRCRPGGKYTHQQEYTQQELCDQLERGEDAPDGQDYAVDEGCVKTQGVVRLWEDVGEKV